MASYQPVVTRLPWPNGPGSVLKYSFGLFIKSGLTEQ
jgi:hypothetical protein